MADDVYFEGDPEFDSRRRHMERVLSGAPRRRWPWVAAILAGGAWTVWRMTRPRSAEAAAPDASGDGEGAPARGRRTSSSSPTT
jgi:hypothetical protein